METRRPTEALASYFEILADADFLDYCPIYDRIARAMAADHDALELLIDHSHARARMPVLFLAATHDLVLRGADPQLRAIYDGESDADPWPRFRELLFANRAEISQMMHTRSTQTNEVGRSANLVPIHRAIAARLRAAGDERPLALVEIGPSAGLNLFADQYDITYTHPDGRAERIGDPTSQVHLHCNLLGGRAPDLSIDPPVIAMRTGLDPAPIDITDEAQCRWLQACVWPGVPDRAERLAAAIAHARLAPPVLHIGDAAADLGPLIDSIGEDMIPVVTSTWALAYLPTERRTHVIETIDAIGARRDLVLITGEDPALTPWVPAIDQRILDAHVGDGTPTVFAVRAWSGGVSMTRPVSLCHPHGGWMVWLLDQQEGSHG
ncbi:MAG: DUF2332 domain-containing protein [Actinobacteria bacterium]|nr:DUF2332 domain-containing protein [Actinomycetota bacterium]